MKVQYDKKADALYINFQKGKSVLYTCKLKDFLFVDIGSKNKIFCIEILDASKHIPGKLVPSNGKHPRKTTPAK